MSNKKEMYVQMFNLDEKFVEENILCKPKTESGSFYEMKMNKFFLIVILNIFILGPTVVEMIYKHLLGKDISYLYSFLIFILFDKAVDLFERYGFGLKKYEKAYEKSYIYFFGLLIAIFCFVTFF